MPAEFTIVAVCPKCGHETTLTHLFEHGDVLLTPPVWMLWCGNALCNTHFKATLRVDCDVISKRPAPKEFGPLKIAD